MMGGTTRRRSDKKPNKSSVTETTAANGQICHKLKCTQATRRRGQLTLKKQVFQSFFIRSTKTVGINIGDVKAGSQPGACVKNTVCNLPIEVNNNPVKMTKMELTPGLGPVQRTVLLGKFLNAMWLDVRLVLAELIYIPTGQTFNSKRRGRRGSKTKFIVMKTTIEQLPNTKNYLIVFRHGAHLAASNPRQKGFTRITLKRSRNKKGKKVLPFAPIRSKKKFYPLKSKSIRL
jgi:hypothetical protein